MAVTMPSKTLGDLFDSISRKTRGDIAPSELSPVRTFDKDAFKSVLKESNKGIKSADQAIKSMMLKRAVLQERIEVARMRGDKRAEASALKQLDFLEDQKKATTELQGLERERNVLLKKRAEFEEKLSDQKYAQSRGAQATLRALHETNNKLYESQDSYDRQLRVVRKISEGVDDVKKAHEQVNKEMGEEQVKLEMMSKTLMGRLGAVMADQFGDGWDRIKSDVMGKLAMFTKIGVAVGFGAAAMRDLSKDSDEVVNTLYKMGGSLDRVQNRFGYYTTSVLQLNAVQTELRVMAASMNMPVEAVDGLSESIIHSIRVLDSAGKISFDKVKAISESALNFSRRTGIGVQESVGLMSTFMNKYGDDSKRAVNYMSSVVGSIVAANDMLEDLGLGKSAIFIEDIANLLKEAADNSDTFSISLNKLGNIASNQMLIAKKFGATYSEALSQAKTLTEFLTKRNPYANYRAGIELAKGIQDDKDIKPFIENKDVDGLTKVMIKKYGMAPNEANMVSKAIIGKAGNWMETVGRLMGGTEAGLKVVTGQLEQYAVQSAQTRLATGATDINALQMAAGTMGVDPKEIENIFNTWTEAAVERIRKGETTSGFISATQFENDPRFKKAQEDAKPESTEKNSPWTPTRVREMLDAVFHSPLLRLIVAAGATASALLVHTGLLGYINLTLSRILSAVSGGRLGGLGPSSAPGMPGTSGPKPTWRERYETAKTQGVRGTAKSAWGGAKKFVGANKGLIGSFALTGSMLALDYATSKMRADEMAKMYNEDGTAKNLHDERLKKSIAEIEAVQGIIDDRKDSLTESEKSYYESMLKRKMSERDAISKQNAAYENNIVELDNNRKQIDEYTAKINVALDPATKRFYQDKIQKLRSQSESLEASIAEDSPDKKEVTSTQRGLEVADNLTPKLIGKSVIDLGARIAGKEIGSRSAVSAISKLGLKAGAKYAGKSALRAIPILGTLLSAGATYKMTEGSFGRKMFAAGGDLLGTGVGQLLTGGLGGGIGGGLAGEYGALSLYDNTFGAPGTNKGRESLVAPMTIPAPQFEPRTNAQQAYNSGVTTGGGAGGRDVLSASVAQFGNQVTLKFSAFDWGKAADFGLSKTYSRQTAQSI
jgi:hypothetical protein